MKYEIEFNVTTFCQAKCLSCVRTILINYNNGFEIAHSNLDKFINSCNNLDIDPEECSIALCGELGDPMMHPNIDKIITLFTDKGYDVVINTNGGLRSPSFYAELAKNPKLSLTFGIDGLDHDINWKYREGVDFQRAWSNMLSWFSNSRRGSWTFLVFDWNKEQILDVSAIAARLHIPLSIIINNRDYGYVGDDERDRLEKIINDL